MIHKDERGAVLVAVLLVLVLLSLLGAGALMRSAVDVKVVKNLGKTKAAYYAAEAAQEIGTGTVIKHFVENLYPYTPTNADISPSGVFDGTDFPGTAYPGTVPEGAGKYKVTYRISNPVYPETPTKVPEGVQFTTSAGGQQLIHFSYKYRVTAKAESLTDGTTEASTVETIRVLETPLVQYFIFFNDDLSWHNGPPMTAWGRVHTNGDLYFAPEGVITFRNYDLSNNFSPNIITAHKKIIYGTMLMEGNSTADRPSQPVNVRVKNPGVIPSASAGDFVPINTSISESNQGSQEARFTAAGVSHVKVGVDNLPTLSFNSLKRSGAGGSAESGFYEEMALAPQKPNVLGMVIDVDTGALRIRLSGHGDVTDLIKKFQVEPGQPVDIGNWLHELRTKATGEIALTADWNAKQPTDMDYGSIVYCKEALVDNVYWADGRIHTFNKPLNDGTAYTPASATGTYSSNPWYPVVLEVIDGREARKVDLTVIDVQLLERWYKDYLDFADDNNFNSSVNMNNNQLLIYVTRSQAGSDNPVAGTGVNALQAVKLIGSKAGRTRGTPAVGVTAIDRQTAPTFTTPTTIASDAPVYIEGDFNSPNAGFAAGVANYNPGMGSAIVCDAITLLSNAWSRSTVTWNKTHAAAAQPTGWHSTYNTALITGRFNWRAGGTAGSEEAGVHNFPRFLENWGISMVGNADPVTLVTDKATCNIIGALVNLWFSQRAVAEHGSGYYSPPYRDYGWDIGFGNWSYWPPFVPSSYSVERESWQQN